MQTGKHGAGDGALRGHTKSDDADAAPAMPPTETCRCAISACDGSATVTPGATPCLTHAIKGQGWTFVAEGGPWLRCSNRKRHLFGSFLCRGWKRPAVAACFTASPIDFGTELASLVHLSALGVGPRVLGWSEIPRSAVDDDPAHPRCSPTVPVLIEEDAGVSLFEALHGAPVPGDITTGTPLAPLGSQRRHVENQKIVFDVMCQLKAMHEAGVYHRDVRSANICVRRFGHAARDIRATLIDFELATDIFGGEPPARSDASYRRLFPYTNEPPTALTIDMGYLMLLGFELEGAPLPDVRRDEIDLPDSFGGACEGLFSYDRFGNARARPLDQARDIDHLAARLGLERLADHSFANEEVAAAAARVVHHGGYLDQADLDAVERDPAYMVATMRERIARRLFALYKQDVRAAGGTPAYEEFDDQPPDLVASNYQQAAGIVSELHATGFEIVPLACLDWTSPSVEHIDEERVEQIAVLEHERWRTERKALGWSWAPTKDVARKTSPNLVAFYRLDETTREWNRAFARRLPQLLAESGFAIVEAKGTGSPKEDGMTMHARDTHLPDPAAPESGAYPKPNRTPSTDAVEHVARSLFAEYQDHLLRDGKPVPYERFEDQPATLQRSCIEQARGLWDKAALIGYSIVPINDVPADMTRVEQLGTGRIEMLARVEHDRWVDERLADGWTYAPVKDVERKTSPYLVAYEELDEEIKEYDREPVRSIVRQLAKAGYALVRPAQRPHHG